MPDLVTRRSFLFTNLITNALTVKGEARIVNMSSNDFSSPFRFADEILRGTPYPRKKSSQWHFKTPKYYRRS
ncbi:predicted protein [Botrytis cinerea T4]|uniref:Uncharacterized protein n=1 Tax=Botryotinia fuckeliana (strain T4) TaxID=999810 RepID=G2YFX2_BOTF4|nr:predicted protein [Botrytis cinerea T4]